MKTLNKIISLTLPFTLTLTSCNVSNTLKKEYTCQEVISIYQLYNDEYEMHYFDYSGDESYEYDEYLIISDNEDASAYFYFFENENVAYTYADENNWNIVLWLYALVVGGGSLWVNIEQHGKMVVQYDDASLLRPLIEYEQNL